MLGILLVCGPWSILWASEASSDGLRYRYAYSADGYNQDRDDVAGSAMVVALFDRMGWGDRLVHFHFNTNFGGKPTHAAEHRKSVLWTAKLFGLIDEVDADDGYFDVSRSPAEKAAAIDHLAEEIRRSDLRRPLVIFCGGGVQVPYAALKLAKQRGVLAEDLQAVTFVSHSVANEKTRQKGHPEYGVNWSDLVKLSPYPSFVDHTSPRMNARKDSDIIQGDQNRTAWNTSPRKRMEGVAHWQWLTGYGGQVEGLGFSGTKGEWLLTRLKAAGAPELGHNGNAEADASDAGMVFGLLPGGTTDADMNDIRTFFMDDRFNLATLRVSGDSDSPQVAFAVADLKELCDELPLGVRDLDVKFQLDESLMAQAYHIAVRGHGAFTVCGGDALGLMYGGLRLAEAIRHEGGPSRVRSESGEPYLEYRGLKMNIPLDARTPSYDDTGDSAVWNIPTVWDFSFWQGHLDAMARHRYNALTLWNPHPFPSLVKLEDFPEVALNDVCTTTFRYDHQSHPRRVDPRVLDSLVTLKKIPIEDKIEFWRKVMAHARDRGIEISFITWNVHLDGAYGKHGIDGNVDNPRTIAYMRSSIREMFKTYPDLAGVGVTAGEMMQDLTFPEREQWLWQTYGLGVKDAVDAQPGRSVRFIHRVWHTGLEPILDAFGDYPGTLDASFKYAKARIYSAPNPEFADSLITSLREEGLRSWWNLRNDDLFCLRWGDPAYVRAFIKNMPPEQTAGFHMGSDGYVWARNFSVKDPQQRGQLEIDRHWYNFMLWGRLGYDPSLDRSFCENALKQRYPEADNVLLHDTWAAASRIIPQVNRFFFKAGDFMFVPEGCQGLREGFLTVDHFISSQSMPGMPEISILDYLELGDQADRSMLRTPLQVAQNLDDFAGDSLRGCARLRQDSLSPELDELVTDLEAMAWLGRYYADKIRGATALAQFRKSKEQTDHDSAVRALTEALESWRQYAERASRLYRPQVLARAQDLDWQALTKDVEEELNRVRPESGD